MNARIIEGQEQPTNDNKLLENIINLMGKIEQGAPGFDEKEFEELKSQMLASGMSVEDLFNLLGDNFVEAVANRTIVDMPIQLLTPTAKIPEYAHLSDACADIYADEDYDLMPGETHAVSTGIALAIPEGYVCHIYARSGLSLKTGLRIANCVGIIDAGYRGEIKVPLWNSGSETYKIEKGMRIAQIEIQQSPAIEFYPVDNVKEYGKDRNGGFGSTGLEKLAENLEINGKV